MVGTEAFITADTQRTVNVRQGHTRRIWIAIACSLAVIGGLLIATALSIVLAATQNLVKVERLPDPFVSIPPSTRPSPAAGGMTLLLIGLDNESKESMGRSDTLMVARITPDRRHVYVVSIPRDSWVEIPGHGTHKINAAYAFGGTTLAIRTVEQLTGVRIDHVAVMGWEGFRAMTDAVGGVAITIPEETWDSSQGVRFTAGTHILNGREALTYVRQRYGLPRGDLDRMHRQQNFLRALMTQVIARDTLTDPGKLSAFLEAAGGAIKVDSGLSNDDLWSLALDAPKLRDGVQFMNAPIDRLDRVVDADGSEQSVVYLDDPANKELWHAVGSDTVDAYLAQHGGDVLGATTR
jgi:LCP family protein required for cell wall assembly